MEQKVNKFSKKVRQMSATSIIVLNTNKIHVPQKDMRIGLKSETYLGAV